MARRVITVVECDRCKAMVPEDQNKSTGNVKHVELAIQTVDDATVVETSGKFSGDLCAKCREALADVIQNKFALAPPADPAPVVNDPAPAQAPA